MLVVKFCGGLGNQMYQYAMSIALSQMYPNQEIKADIFHYNLLNEHNGFELDQYFNFVFPVATRKEVRKVYPGFIPGNGIGILPLKIRETIAFKLQWYYLFAINRIFKGKKEKVVNEPEFSEKASLLETGDWYISGMWQDLGFFKDYKEQIAKSMIPKINLSQDDLEVQQLLISGKAIAVHVRGGDFLKLGDRYNLCDKEYYQTALGNFDKSLPVYVFTDDPQHAKNVIGNARECVVVSHGVNGSIIDIFMLSHCKYLVISNSTFAFWGAFLNKVYDTIVCPEYMRKDGNKNIRSVKEEDWISVVNIGP